MDLVLFAVSGLLLLKSKLNTQNHIKINNANHAEHNDYSKSAKIIHSITFGKLHLNSEHLSTQC